MTDLLITAWCTDRGQHPQRRLWRGSPDGVTALGEPGHADLASWQRDGGVRFRCPTCGADKQLSAATWARLVAGLAQAGVSELDISLLPF